MLSSQTTNMENFYEVTVLLLNTEHFIKQIISKRRLYEISDFDLTF